MTPKKSLEPENPEKWSKNLRKRTRYKMVDQLIIRYIWGNNKSFDLDATPFFGKFMLNYSVEGII